MIVMADLLLALGILTAYLCLALFIGQFIATGTAEQPVKERRR